MRLFSPEYMYSQSSVAGRSPFLGGDNVVHVLAFRIQLFRSMKQEKISKIHL